MDFTDRVALVTGAASGIGRAVASALAERGAAVVAVDIDGEHLDAAVAAMRSGGGRVEACCADVTREDQVEVAVALAGSRFGGLDLAVNSAGVAQPPAPLHELDEAVFDRVVAVNLKGLFLCLKHEIAAMRTRGGGAVVNLGSVAGLGGSRKLAAYAATKHAVLGLTRSAALENARHGIRINAVCPGIVDTPMTRTHGEAALEAGRRMSPMGRLAEAGEVAEAVLWLLSPAASFTTGAVVTVDGGYTAS